MNDTQQQVETNEKRCRRPITGPENHVPYEIEPVVSPSFHLTFNKLDLECTIVSIKIFMLNSKSSVYERIYSDTDIAIN